MNRYWSRTLLWSVAIFLSGGVTVGMAFIDQFPVFAVLRAIAGIGIYATLPIGVSLVSLNHLFCDH